MANYTLIHGQLVNSDELIHYGVPGMRWGVRKNIRMLSTHRRNSSIGKIKADHKSGKITRDVKNYRISKAKAKQKIERSKLKEEYKNASDKGKHAKKLATRTLAEVPASRFKKGLHAVNSLMAVGHLGAIAVKAATVTGIGPNMLPVFAAIEVGRHFVTRKVVETLT